jgi:type IV secretion system protein VirB4
MTRAKTTDKHTPWFAQAGAACSIIPVSRFVGPNIFALKRGGYGCLFSLAGIDEEGRTDDELERVVRSIEGALRGLPEGACLYQYTRITIGFELPRQAKYDNPVTHEFVNDRLTFLNENAKFRRISLFWCLTLEPPITNIFRKAPPANANENTRRLAELRKAAALLEGHLESSIGLKLLGKQEPFRFFSYLFNLEEWADRLARYSAKECG